MWTTLIPTAIAAALLATVVNLASEINKIQGARHLAGAELTLQRDVVRAGQTGFIEHGMTDDLSQPACEVLDRGRGQGNRSHGMETIAPARTIH